MALPWSSYVHVLVQILLIWVTDIGGVIRCACTSPECKENGQDTCVAVKACYAELYHNTLSRGCDPTPLACENKKPAGLDLEWPALYCCNHGDLCNQHVIPTVITRDPQKSDKERPKQSPSSNCSNSQPEQRPEVRKVINPIYIAVPVAGVCVLLALIIFAMYLLRRRTDYHHDSYHHYHHEHVPTLADKEAAVVASHHCHCSCQRQSLAASSKAGNRCTDSERSSSGSETKLFIQS